MEFLQILFSIKYTDIRYILIHKMNLFQYLTTIERFWNNGEGTALARLINISGSHASNKSLHVENCESMIERHLEPPVDEVINTHLKTLYYLHETPPNYGDAYKCQMACVQAVVKLLEAIKEENWCLPIMYVTCLDLRLLALKCENTQQVAKRGHFMEKAAECLMLCFRVCTADNRTDERDTKRLGMLHLVNQMFKVYFRINKLHLCKPLILAIDRLPFKESFPLAQQITYKYFVGRKAMYDSDYKLSDEYLSFAFNHCLTKFWKNKRLILIYLVPVKMLLGHMPRKETMEKFKVPQFYELANALKQGNIRQFDDVMQKYEAFFIDTGIYIIVEKLKIIAYRNLFKKVYLILQTHQIDLQHFFTALQFVGEEDITMDETHCIVANLIAERKIKGYISYQHNKLVVSKKENPFPNLNIQEFYELTLLDESKSVQQKTAETLLIASKWEQENSIKMTDEQQQQQQDQTDNQNRLKHDDEKKVENTQVNAERQQKSETPINKVFLIT
ncbi:hypothetical protein PVAND_013720 [Polypedilum vanderplanki]|uniref:PCI domain-containing protein 2 homolog n=1 Tax=Polypedilum vanderplanki TaxID=319348 RepID=A0A9J6CQK1_POLVA|nr:hypothetical protein PVAND_013720 [Polypedilum vanderplanki]